MALKIKFLKLSLVCEPCRLKMPPSWNLHEREGEGCLSRREGEPRQRQRQVLEYVHYGAWEGRHLVLLTDLCTAPIAKH